MCEESFVCVDPSELDQHEFEQFKRCLELTALAMSPVLQAMIGVALEDEIIRNCTGPSEESFDDWTAEVKCIHCDRWGVVPFEVATEVAAAYLAKQVIEYVETGSGDDISPYILS